MQHVDNLAVEKVRYFSRFRSIVCFVLKYAQHLKAFVRIFNHYFIEAGRGGGEQFTIQNSKFTIGLRGGMATLLYAHCAA